MVFLIIETNLCSSYSCTRLSDMILSRPSMDQSVFCCILYMKNKKIWFSKALVYNVCLRKRISPSFVSPILYEQE